MNDGRRIVTRALRAYLVIVVAYVALIGWWVYFFSSQPDRVQADLADIGHPLDEAQVDALRDASGGDARMFLFEGGFIGLLLLGSALLVLRALRREQDLGAQQRNFLSAVTHELRSPLAAIKLYVDSLLGGRVTGEKADRYLRHARQDVERLETLVEDVLTARRLDEGRLPHEREPLDLAELVRDSFPRFSARYATEGVELTLEAEGRAPVEGDRDGLLQVVDNLVSNAVKYGGEAGPVRLSVERSGARVHLAVRDSGPGVPAADSARLTDPFVRGGDEQVRTRPGVGLGLFIVREIVSAHGGRFRLVTSDSGGTTALVDLPANGGEAA